MVDDKHYYKEFRNLMELRCLFGKCDKCSYVQDDGTGVHKVAVYDLFETTEKVECPECDGKGRKTDDCESCNGSGDCPECEGTGHSSTNCVKCGGKGKVWEDINGVLKESGFSLERP
jgi:DnaJ-class molecular chaperone